MDFNDTIDQKMDTDTNAIVKMDVDNSDTVISDISISRTVDPSSRGPLLEGRKRSWSGSSDSSYDSDAKLEPVEEEFERFIEEVNKKW